MENKYLFVDDSVIETYREKLNAVDNVRLINAVRKHNSNSVHSSIKLYRDIRDNYCALNIVLNERRAIAPIFRLFRKPNRNKGLSNDEVLLARDRQVIDLHYLFVNHRDSVNPNDEQYRPLFESDEFNSELASEFASLKWKSGTKAQRSLKLKSSIQEELWILREKKIADRHRGVIRSIEKMKYQIHELSDKPASRLRHEEIPNRVEEFTCLKYGRGSVAVAARFYMLRGNGIGYCDHEWSALRKRLQMRKNWFRDRLDYTNWA
ncbi:MAG: hypothetical protein KME67_19300 [Candidatus Thiodiazotropha sp. (ex Codakia orbicularis)]|nr:hypothetical protein [Candidatus Thiodiazotropha sp. (ex Codakia orbicularis)]